MEVPIYCVWPVWVYVYDVDDEDDEFIDDDEFVIDSLIVDNDDN